MYDVVAEEDEKEEEECVHYTSQDDKNKLESIQSEADVSWNVMQMAIPKESLFLWNGVYDVLAHTVQMDPSDFTFVSESFPAALIHRKQFREASIFIMWSTTNQKKQVKGDKAPYPRRCDKGGKGRRKRNTLC